MAFKIIIIINISIVAISADLYRLLPPFIWLCAVKSASQLTSVQPQVSLCCSSLHVSLPTKAIHTFKCSLTLFLTRDCQQVRNGSHCHFGSLQLQNADRHTKVWRCTTHIAHRSLTAINH